MLQRKLIVYASTGCRTQWRYRGRTLGIGEYHIRTEAATYRPRPQPLLARRPNCILSPQAVVIPNNQLTRYPPMLDGMDARHCSDLTGLLMTHHAFLPGVMASEPRIIFFVVVLEVFVLQEPASSLGVCERTSRLFEGWADNALVVDEDL